MLQQERASIGGERWNGPLGEKGALAFIPAGPFSSGQHQRGAMLAEADPGTPGAVLSTVGRALISKTGGASGPLYGTAFRQAAKSLAKAWAISALSGSAVKLSSSRSVASEYRFSLTSAIDCMSRANSFYGSARRIAL